MKLALFNGFPFHYEMFGYLIHYCKIMNHELTIYCYPNHDMSWLTFYYSMYTFVCKDVSLFHNDYDYIFLTTDDDPNYPGDVHKTICIDHYYKIRSPQYAKRITTRPFDERPYALPVYPIFNDKKRLDEIVVAIIGGHTAKYDIDTINRIVSDKPIVIKVVSRVAHIDLFQGCKFPVQCYKGISTFEMIDLVERSSYLLVDVTLPKTHTNESMSGSIPLAFSTLTPLIISKETNSYYKFKNCIEYEDDIVLKEIDTTLLKAERDAMIQHNHSVLNELVKKTKMINGEEVEYCTFTNDDFVSVLLLNHAFTSVFKMRDNHEVLFRRINTFLIKHKFIKHNIIDLGSWAGDNSIPWAKNIEGIVYAIDPSHENCDFINKMCERNEITNVKTIQSAISNKNEVLYTNDNINHCSFIYETHGVGIKVDAVSLDYLYEKKEIENIGYIHLDVEGMEYKILEGSRQIIDMYRPIISFEQHLDIDDYSSIASYLKKKDYAIFLVDEILPGCRYDCRNSFAFPNEICSESFIASIHAYIEKNILLPR